MTIAICTLFEKDYHHGVAALANSLVASGFKGSIYAGFRGSIPPWAADAGPAHIGDWRDARRKRVSGECELAFLPMDTSDHFTNVKPDFMLRLFATVPDLSYLFYLDPDICVTEKWEYLGDWSRCGVALCEDVNSPIEKDHPRRVGWRRHFAEHGLQLVFRTTAYVNGGCVGVAREHICFLENWRHLSRCMAATIGGLGATSLEGGRSFRELGFGRCFDKSDQDVLNAAIEMTGRVDCSILSRTAMGFEAGTAVMPHALGARKPWRRKYMRDSLISAVPPTAADKAFWQFAGGPLRSMSTARIRNVRRALVAASVIGRVYRRR
jgi:hypothetical protein